MALSSSADIAAHGLHVPITIHPDGTLLDGRNRARACEAVGVTPARETWTGELGTEVDYVISLNLARRHLDESQRAMVAARLATLPHGQKKGDASIEASAQPDAAARLNVSRSSVQRARVVLAQGSRTDLASIDAKSQPEALLDQSGVAGGIDDTCGTTRRGLWRTVGRRGGVVKAVTGRGR